MRDQLGPELHGLFDTHAHLNDPRFDEDREAVLEKMQAMGMLNICVGADMESSRTGIELAERTPGLYASVGVHPHDAKDFREADIPQLREWSKRDKVVAIGEIGLDYYYDLSPRDVQKRVLSEQLDLACELDLPVIFHIRDAHGDMIDIFRSRSMLPRGIIHCFSGSAETALEYVRMGFYISFSGPLTFKKAPNLQAAAKAVPLDRLLVETDSPYLAPEPVRGRRNEPANVWYVCEKLAELRELPMEEMARITTENGCRIYGIPYPCETDPSRV